MKKEYIKPAILEELMLVAEEAILTDSVKFDNQTPLDDDEEWS